MQIRIQNANRMRTHEGPDLKHREKVKSFLLLAGGCFKYPGALAKARKPLEPLQGAAQEHTNAILFPH
jgi:hypothetical protein